MGRLLQGKGKLLAGLLSGVLLAMLLVACGGGSAAPVASPLPPATAITLLPVVNGFTQPVAITNAGDNSGRLFIAEQGGP